MSPSGRGIASQLGIANADAGSALNSCGNGRLQLSELHYVLPFAQGEVYLGMLDPTRFLDGSDIANDETQQFLGAGFVNNPLIDFPDYTLGIAYHYTASANQPGFAVFLSSSNGLGDNSSASYGQLINVHDKEKGLFSAAELYYPWKKIKFRSGLWLNTAIKPQINNPTEKAKNYGIYTSIDASEGQHQWNLRYGYTNPDVTASNHFVAIAYQYQFKQAALGLGLAHQRMTHQSADSSNTPNTQAELYLRINPAPGLSISPSIQYLHGQSSSQTPQQLSKRNWVAGLRLSYYF
ncbi:MAG: carbohydrate porin [Gammaproteobacteria bacterium]|nr:carbohydrate porin [Gammaproteobacteria bacterium]